MNDILELNKQLLNTVKQLVVKVKEQKQIIVELKTHSQHLTDQFTLTDEQKQEIEQLLAETKEILEKDL